MRVRACACVHVCMCTCVHVCACVSSSFSRLTGIDIDAVRDELLHCCHVAAVARDMQQRLQMINGGDTGVLYAQHLKSGLRKRSPHTHTHTHTYPHTHTPLRVSNLSVRVNDVAAEAELEGVVEQLRATIRGQPVELGEAVAVCHGGVCLKANQQSGLTQHRRKKGTHTYTHVHTHMYTHTATHTHSHTHTQPRSDALSLTSAKVDHQGLDARLVPIHGSEMQWRHLANVCDIHIKPPCLLGNQAKKKQQSVSRLNPKEKEKG